jgi:CheY-like chemotaxis protein
MNAKALAVRPVGLVLLVEDDPRLRMAIAQLLLESGYAVTAASNGVEALRVLEGCEPDVVLSDVRMPMMDGITLAAHIAARAPSLPVVLMSADYNAEEPARKEARAFIQKPFDVETVDAVFRALFQH